MILDEFFKPNSTAVLAEGRLNEFAPSSDSNHGGDGGGDGDGGVFKLTDEELIKLLNSVRSGLGNKWLADVDQKRFTQLARRDQDSAIFEFDSWLEDLGISNTGFMITDIHVNDGNKIWHGFFRNLDEQVMAKDTTSDLFNMRRDDPRIQQNQDTNTLAKTIYAQMVAERGQPMDSRQRNTWMAIAQTKAAAKLSNPAAQKIQQSAPSGFPAQGSERRVAKDADQFESQGMGENAEELSVGDPVIITGKGLEFEGATGEISDFDRQKRFVVVNLYNHGPHSFHSSDVSFNEYAGSDDEEARMYDAGEFRDDPRDEMNEQGVSEGSDELDSYRAAFVAGEMEHARGKGQTYQFKPEEDNPQFKSLATKYLQQYGQQGIANGSNEKLSLFQRVFPNEQLIQQAQDSIQQRMTQAGKDSPAIKYLNNAHNILSLMYSNPTEKLASEFYNNIRQARDVEQQGVTEGADDKFGVADKVEELVYQYRLYDKRGWTDLFTKLAGRKLEVAEIRREIEYASKFLDLLDSIRMRSDYRGQQDPKKDQELIDLSNQWLSLFNKATDEFKGISGRGVAEGKLKINYDSWLSKVPNTINDKMKKVLRVMQDGKVRSRADMLRAAGIDPNPRSPGGVAGMEGTDYYLYKKGLLDVVDIVKGQKYFKISKNASRGMAEGSAADGSVNYTLGHTPDAEYVYSIYRDGKKEGTYHSVDQAREIMGNMKLTSPNREYKIKRDARNKMAGPASQLPEQGVSEGHGNYAGDRPVNLGGVSMKKIQIGDTVRYIDQKAQVVDMSRDREHARITIPSSSTTKTVLTSDLRQLGRGMDEGSTYKDSKPWKRAVDDWDRLMTDIEREDPEFEKQRQQDIKRTLKTQPMAGPRGQLPEQDMAEQRMSAAMRMQRAADKQLAKSDASLRRTPSSIPKPEPKQVDQDSKQSAQAVHESRLRLMASIIKTQ